MTPYTTARSGSLNRWPPISGLQAAPVGRRGRGDGAHVDCRQAAGGAAEAPPRSSTLSCGSVPSAGQPGQAPGGPGRAGRALAERRWEQRHDAGRRRQQQGELRLHAERLEQLGSELNGAALALGSQHRLHEAVGSGRRARWATVCARASLVPWRCSSALAGSSPRPRLTPAPCGRNSSCYWRRLPRRLLKCLASLGLLALASLGLPACLAHGSAWVEGAEKPSGAALPACGGRQCDALPLLARIRRRLQR